MLTFREKIKTNYEIEVSINRILKEETKKTFNFNKNNKKKVCKSIRVNLSNSQPRLWQLNNYMESKLEKITKPHHPPNQY